MMCVTPARATDTFFRDLQNSRMLKQRSTKSSGGGGMFARRAPGACPARYLCIKYLISSPHFILT